MHDRLENFHAAYRLSQRARAVIRQNVFLSLGTVVVLALLYLLSALNYHAICTPVPRSPMARSILPRAMSSRAGRSVGVGVGVGVGVSVGVGVGVGVGIGDDGGRI